MKTEEQRQVLFDVRTLERHIAAGRITREAYDRHLADLEDCADACEKTTTRMAPLWERKPDEGE